MCLLSVDKNMKLFNKCADHPGINPGLLPIFSGIVLLNIIY